MFVIRWQECFCVEDLSVPPPPSANPYMNMNGIQNNNNRAPNKEVNDAILFSKLQAYDLVTGNCAGRSANAMKKASWAIRIFLGPRTRKRQAICTYRKTTGTQARDA